MRPSNHLLVAGLIGPLPRGNKTFYKLIPGCIAPSSYPVITGRGGLNSKHSAFVDLKIKISVSLKNWERVKQNLRNVALFWTAPLYFELGTEICGHGRGTTKLVTNKLLICFG